MAKPRRRLTCSFTSLTNVSVLSPMSTPNIPSRLTSCPGLYTNGMVMFSYLDPVPGRLGRESAFVYYSNVRMVEISPYIVQQPLSHLPGHCGDKHHARTSAANYSFHRPVYQSVDPGRRYSGNWFCTSNCIDQPEPTLSDSLVLNIGTPRRARITGLSGAIRRAQSPGMLPSVIEVISAPTNVNVACRASSAVFTTTSSGRVAPIAFQ